MARTLSDEHVVCVGRQVETYLSTHSYITNRELRALSGITYDQAIDFFNRMVGCGKLERIGKASGTKYQAPNPS
jgi:hypothetical protein